MSGNVHEAVELAKRTVCPNQTDPLDVEYRTSWTPSSPWDRRSMEQVLDLVLPQSLVDLWEEVGTLRLFEDVTYGQWGLVLWSPADAVSNNLQRVARSEDRLRGDLAIGEFLGDSDLLVLRCDPGSRDFGRVLIELPMDRRQEWPIVGETLGAFLLEYVRKLGEKYWE